MSFISYAQNLEDVVLWKALKNVENGFYIDVGANDPIIDSVTRSFYNLGWRGINIEPILGHFNDLVADRPEDINLNCALNERSGQLDIWVCDIRGWATLDKEVAKAHEAEGHNGQWHQVTVRTLADVCEEYQPENIHFLKVDVEGLEVAVLKGNDWDKFRPWVVVVESIFPNTQIDTHSEVEELLIGNNYLFAYADGLNRFYVALEHQDLVASLKYPPNVFDDYQTYNEYTALKNAEVLGQQLANYKQEYNDALAKILTILNDKNDKLDVLAVGLEEVSGRLNHAEKYQDLIHKTSSLTAENERVHTAYSALSQAYDAANERIYAQEQEIAQLRKHFDKIYSSTSWRISSPVRLLGRLKNRNSPSSQASSAGLLKRGLRKLSRMANQNPRLRMLVVRTSKKLGLYNALRNLYLKILLGSSPNTAFSAKEILAAQNNTFSSFKSSDSLSIDELHRRIKKELEVNKTKGDISEIS
ncbi:FkbM family methyltransferase [Morganella morganii]|uniref:FkbM family methyltransferase n=1 Tax=Morganella morganii TaxID=582 RepID=UPI0006683636|nr:FkbM family methyltransferase [Morganella morganii]